MHRGDTGVREPPATARAHLRCRVPWWSSPAEAPKLGRVPVIMWPGPQAWPEGGRMGATQDGQEVLCGAFCVAVVG